MSSRFEILDTPIPGVKRIQRQPLGDHRGYFERLFCARELQPLLAGRSIVQINHSLTSRRGAVRGLHFQHPPHAEIKIVSCLRGEVFDVAVDLRQGSATFLHWHAAILSADNHQTLLIPEGCAHGFQALEPESELLYLVTAFYAPEAEEGLRYDDPRLAIAWPLPVTDLSLRDQHHPLINADFSGLRL
ncbi:MAG: dTDP-4-dehydrorhamnose 3,5-epimerase [Candidatus Contendobacter sp.]|nr:dTDP-4-dehydrorhamnose 3,5-epimerase [Candidatus Contendobacter sp.]